MDAKTDLILLVDGKNNTGKTRIPVNMSLITAKSPVFSAFFSESLAGMKIDNSSTPEIHIDNLDIDILQELVYYCYHDQVRKSSLNVFRVSLFEAAIKYQMLELVKKCEPDLVEMLSKDNAFESLYIADICDLNMLLERTVSFLCESWTEDQIISEITNHKIFHFSDKIKQKVLVLIIRASKNKGPLELSTGSTDVSSKKIGFIASIFSTPIPAEKMTPATLAKLLFCFVGLQVSYILWGVVQERMMTEVYKGGLFKSSTFCVFGNRFLALILSGFIVWRKRATATESIKMAPYHSYIPSSLSNSLSSWAQYEALKYLSFPTQVLSKSCKIIPVMFVGIVVNGKSYPFLEYLEAFFITAGVATFTMSQSSHSSSAAENDSALGIFLIILYLACDSFTSQWQSKVFKTYGIDQYQMMFGINIWSILFTSAFLIESGEGIESIMFILDDPRAMMDTILLSISSAVGQLFIFYTIKEFGPVMFTIMMTTRQVLSLFISCIIFTHPLGLLSWVGATIVFAVVFNRIRRKGSD